jgi:hypothetical protein
MSSRLTILWNERPDGVLRCRDIRCREDDETRQIDGNATTVVGAVRQLNKVKSVGWLGCQRRNGIGGGSENPSALVGHFIFSTSVTYRTSKHLA